MNPPPEQNKPGVFFDDTAEAPPKNMEAAYRAAEDLAWKNLGGRDPAVQARRCGAAWQCGAFELTFFNQRLRVSPAEVSVQDVVEGRSLGVWERVLVLHYLASSQPPAPGEDLISFKHVPAGGFYYDAYRRRAEVPLARMFGGDPRLLLEAGKRLGAEPADFGDAAVRLWSLPKVPVVAVVHGGDEEFPPEANLLYLPSVTAYFCTEDIAVLGGLVAGRLVRQAKSMEGGA